MSGMLLWLLIGQSNRRCALIGTFPEYSLQHLFQIDPFNYNGQVFAGLACLQLGQYEESKKNYKGAISKQPDGPLAWKVYCNVSIVEKLC